MNYQVAAVLGIDVSPRFLWGHTVKDGNQDQPAIAMSILAQRLHELSTFLEAEGIPCLFFDLAVLDRVSLDDLREKGRILVCGIYADQCVAECATRLKGQGFSVSVLEDASLWEIPYRWTEWPRGLMLEAVKDYFPDLVENNPELWEGDWPCLSPEPE